MKRIGPPGNFCAWAAGTKNAAMSVVNATNNAAGMLRARPMFVVFMSSFAVDCCEFVVSVASPARMR